MVKNKIICFVIVVITSTVLLQSIGYVQALSSPSIKIVEPGNREIVDGYHITVRGSSVGLEAPNLHLYVVVHPIETSFWRVKLLLNIDREGNWITSIYLGESNVGNNQDYAIKAMITTEVLREGTLFRVNELPSSIAEHQIIVTRRG
jgi:hypothetical protein